MTKELIKLSTRTMLLIAAAALAVTGRLTAAPLQEVDLASTTAWTLNGAVKTVPGGGWNAQGIAQNIDNVVYQRSITIPNAGADKTYKLLFGSVNHGCEVYIDNKLLLTRCGPMMPFEVDLTGQVTSGGTHTLKVVAYSFQHYGLFAPKGFMRPQFSEGISKYVKLAVYPQVYIDDVFPQTSVAKRQLTYDLWIHNTGSTARTVSLNGSLSSWNGDPWSYPSIPAQDVSLPAKSVTRVKVGPVAWDLPATSYWWPNIPFRENYTARLHYLHLSVKENGIAVDTLRQRFGFVEHAEGPADSAPAVRTYYTVNGVRLGSQPSDGTNEDLMGWYDCYATCPAFLPPTGANTGCPETWKRYMRLGINTNRTHQSTPTEYMMDAADEVGFMLIPETGERGGVAYQKYHPVYSPQCERELAMTCRNHPSVCRYSLTNECEEWVGTGDTAATLIDTITVADWTRPLTFEQSAWNIYLKPPGYIWYGRATSNPRGHAFIMEHYQPYRAWLNNQPGIRGMGEYAYSDPDWGGPKYCGNGALEREADLGLEMRRVNIVYFAIWTVTLYWPNFLEGMNAAKLGWILHPDRTDGVDGWGSHVVKFIQKQLDPYVVVDRDLHDRNICYSADWPATVPSFAAGASVNRELIVFNGGLFGNRMAVAWEARRGSATGAVAASGIIDSIAVSPGERISKTLSFTLPSATATADTVQTRANGRIMYKEDRVYYNVGTPAQKLYIVMKSVLYDGDSPVSAASSRMSVLSSGPPALIRTVVGGRVVVSPLEARRFGWIDVYDVAGRHLARRTLVQGAAAIDVRSVSSGKTLIVRMGR